MFNELVFRLEPDADATMAGDCCSSMHSLGSGDDDEGATGLDQEYKNNNNKKDYICVYIYIYIYIYIFHMKIPENKMKSVNCSRLLNMHFF